MNGIGIRSSPSRDTGSTLLSLSILADVMVGTKIRFGVLIQSPIPYGSEKCVGKGHQRVLGNYNLKSVV